MLDFLKDGLEERIPSFMSKKYRFYEIGFFHAGNAADIVYIKTTRCLRNKTANFLL